MIDSRTAPLYVVSAVVGLWLLLNAVEHWAPDSLLRLPDRAATLERSAVDADLLGCRLSSDPTQQVSAGLRLTSTTAELRALVASEKDPERRRRLLESAPPLRFGIRYHEVVSPNGATGSLLLEYDGDSRLVGVSFGHGGPMREVKGELKAGFARHVAEVLLGGRLTDANSSQEQRGMEWTFRSREHPDGPVAYVFLGNAGDWMAHRQPAMAMVQSTQSLAFWRWPIASQLQFYVLVLVAFAALGLLLWRLSHQRAGFNQAPVLLGLLLVGLVLPVLKHYLRGDLRILAALWLYLLLNQVGVFLLWVVAEAELREWRPRSVEGWDRLLRWKPLAGTGRELLAGLAVGAMLAGLVASSGAAARPLGGGYGSFLVILPDYWSLPTPINWGLALTALTGLFIGCGGRLGGRPGLALGCALSAAGWSLAVPIAPVSWSLLGGALVAVVAAWVVWRHGLLALAVASIVAFSLPTAWVAWSAFPLLTTTAVLSSLPVLLLPLGVFLVHQAPRYGDAQSVAPAYVSDLERQAKLQGEVDLLRNLQLALLPPARPEVASAPDLAWHMVPADTVGGDFLDVVEDREGRLWLAIADVAGHGIACSVLTAYTKAAVAEHATAGVGVGEAMQRIRRLFRRLRSNRTLVTLLLVLWDPKRGELSVASAGHPPLLLYADGEVRELGEPGLPLGSQLGHDARSQTLLLEEGALVVAYSDGVPEAMSPTGEVFGYDRWPEMLPTLVHESAPRALEALLRTVDDHLSERPTADDVTALVARLVRIGVEDR